jgi:UDP-3-O-[3-hydroxymyristoyl] glucosamine N-acyltransferase
VAIHPYTRLGNSNFVCSNTSIGHGCTIGDNCWINSGVSIGGETRIGDGCFLGINAAIGDNIVAGGALLHWCKYADLASYPSG